jgi:phosphoribosylaminoimidazolecarboxamide formyltransferase/IMP cyclohydrolase
MKRLKDWVGEIFLDFKSLIDGGLIVQTSYRPEAITLEDIKKLPLGYQDSKNVIINRKPTEQEYKDMWFGWLVEAGVTSNSVIYVKDGVTVGIGTGEQDRVGVAKIARDKAYEKLKDRICFEKYGVPYNDLELKEGKDSPEIKELEEEIKKTNGGWRGAVMVSDAFFPFRDGADVGLSEGITAIIQPGGSLNDYQTIEACNDAKATMIFTGQRSFKH